MEQIHHHTRPKIRQAIIQVSSQKVEYCILVFLGLVIRRAMFGYFGKYGQTFEFSMFFSHLTRRSFHQTWKNIVLQDFKSFLKGFDWKDDCLKINVFALFDNYKYAINYGQSSYQSQRMSTVYITAFLRKRPELLTCFLFVDIFGVVISFNVVFQNFPLIINKYLITTF